MIRRRRPLAGLVGLVVATVISVPGAVAQTEPTGAEIDLAGRSPWVAPEDRAELFVTASGDAAGATVQVEVFSALDSVEELEESATEDVGVRLSRTEPVPIDALPEGPDGTRVLTVPVSTEAVDGATVQIVEPGVHPVVISLLDADGGELDQIRTPLVRLGEDTDDRRAPDLAVLLDVAAPPSLQPDGTRVIDPGVVRQLGRVGDLLAAHPDVEVSVAVLPDTIEALQSAPAGAADALIDQLRGRELLSVPYLPLSVSALLGEDLGGLVAPLVERGEAVLADRLDASTVRGVWTSERAVGRAGARLLTDLGYPAVIVEPEPTVAEGDEPAPLLDSGPRPVADAGALAGMVVDPVLSDEVAAPSGDDADAAHVALARLLLRPVEADRGDDDEDDTTTVLVRPGALGADPVLDRLLDLLGDPASPVRVGGLDLVDAVVDQDVEPAERAEVDVPDLGDVAPRVLAANSLLDAFQSLIGASSPRTDDLRLQIATAVAATTPEPRRDAAMDLVEGVLGAAFGSVRLSGERNLNLTSRRGTLPITVENANPFPVDVVIRTASDRLRFPAGRDVPVTVEAGDAVRVDVRVEALATGSVPVTVELWTADDRMRLDARSLNVRSTAFSGVGLLLSFGALGVLVVWWVRSWRRNRGAPDVDPVTDAGTMG